MTYEDLQQVIRTLLTMIEVDGAYYLARNPNVAAGIRQGDIRSAREHFVDHGYFEGRLPYRIEVDETWYKETTPIWLTRSAGANTPQGRITSMDRVIPRAASRSRRTGHSAASDTAPNPMTFTGSAPPRP